VEALGAIDTSAVLSILMDEFSAWKRPNDKADKEKVGPRLKVGEALIKMPNDKADEDNIGLRLKVGEALIKIIRRFGDFGPIYGERIISVFLAMLKNSSGDEEFRASILSNIAETCKLMSYKLQTVITEVKNTKLKHKLSSLR
jgi:hypothetical protein